MPNERIKIEHTSRWTIYQLFKVLIFLTVLLCVMVTGSFIRSYIVQHAADKASTAASRVEAVSTESRDASLETLQTLRDILARLENNQNQPALNNQAIIDALQAIARIEGHLCGGPCPESG